MMSALEVLRILADKRASFSILLAILCLRYLGQTRALGVDDSNGAYASYLKTLGGGQDLRLRYRMHEGSQDSVYMPVVEDQPQLLRRKRDLQEIIAQKNLTFPDQILRRTKDALKDIQSVTTDMKNVIENPPVPTQSSNSTNITTTPFPNSEEGNQTTSTGATEGDTNTTITTTAEAPVNTNNTDNTTSTSTSSSNSTITEATSATNATLPTTSTTSTTMKTTSATNGAGTSTTSTTTKTTIATLTTTSTTSTTTNTTSDTNGAGNSRRSRTSIHRPLTDNSLGLVRRISNDGTVAKNAYSVTEAIVSLKIAFNASERVMMDKLSAQTVVNLEESLESLRAINESMPDLNEGQEKENFMFHINYLLLSVKHSLQRMEDEERASGLLSQADDITIVITAAFCILALAIAGGIFAYSFKTRKDHRGNYSIDKSPLKSNLRNSPSRNPSSANNPGTGDPSFFSIPSGVTVQTRSNPMYSSHRSVDVERPSATTHLDKYRYDEPRSEDGAGTADGRNANGRGHNASSPNSNSGYRGGGN